jgi:hypothetical protein
MDRRALRMLVAREPLGQMVDLGLLLPDEDAQALDRLPRADRKSGDERPRS